MSNIVATVLEIQCCDSLHIVKFIYKNVSLTMMSLEIGSNIKVGSRVNLAINSSHIAIAKNLEGEVSYSNQLKTKIIKCENGKLLSSLTLDFDGTILESIITVDSSKRMNLKVGDEVIALIKASELSIFEVIDV